MKKIIGLLVIIVLFASCDSNKKLDGLRGYDSKVLKNWAENIIIPSYKNYQEKAVRLTQTAKSFEESPTEANLSTLKDAWLESYKAYQKTIIFNFENYNVVRDIYYAQMSNTYPVREEDVEKNISEVKSGKEIDLEATFVKRKYTYQGFPALDYLLFSEGKDLNYYQQNKAARTYVTMLAKTLQSNIDKVVAYWGENKDKYINDTNQSRTGAYSLTVNAFIEVYEQIRSEKVGIACGATPPQKDVPVPNYIEAYYKADVSKKLLKIALQSSQDFFNGKSFDGNDTAKSLSDILKEIGHEDLVNEINKQYDIIYKQIESTSETLRDLADQGKSESKANQRPLYNLYLAIQRNVGNYKTKMLQALNVQVGYQDADMSD